MVDKGYVVYMFDKRNYGFSSREKAMDEPAYSFALHTNLGLIAGGRAGN